MSDLSDTFDLRPLGIRSEDVAYALRRLRSQGLLGAFLAHHEVLGDDSFYIQARRDGSAETLRDYCSRFGNGEGFVVRLERNCVSLTPLRPAEPPNSGVGKSV